MIRLVETSGVTPPNIPPTPKQPIKSNPSFKGSDCDRDYAELKRSKRELEELSSDSETPKFLSAIQKGVIIVFSALLGGASMRIGLGATGTAFGKLSKTKPAQYMTGHFSTLTGLVKTKSIELFNKFTNLKSVQAAKTKIGEFAEKIGFNKFKNNETVAKVTGKIKSGVVSAYQYTKGVLTPENAKKATTTTLTGASGIAAGAEAAGFVDRTTHTGDI